MRRFEDGIVLAGILTRSDRNIGGSSSNLALVDAAKHKLSVGHIPVGLGWAVRNADTFSINDSLRQKVVSDGGDRIFSGDSSRGKVDRTNSKDPVHSREALCLGRDGEALLLYLQLGAPITEDNRANIFNSGERTRSVANLL
jgi:hypothetical protein